MMPPTGAHQVRDKRLERDFRCRLHDGSRLPGHVTRRDCDVIDCAGCPPAATRHRVRDAPLRNHPGSSSCACHPPYQIALVA